MNEETLFHEALARSSRHERAAFLDQSCRGQPELRAAVEALLLAHEQSGAFLSSPGVLAPARDDDSAPDGQSGRVPETKNVADSTNGSVRPVEPATVDSENPPGLLQAAGSIAPAADTPRNIGRYKVKRLLGRGGMGAVYLAHDPELDRPVALKIPKLSGPDAEERFLREARAAAAVSHPNLCPVYDAGRADGFLYLAMAYVPGPTLTDVLREKGSFTPPEAAAIATAVARGMAEAHRHGIVHRDLKPGNILLDRRGEPVVTDFGLALRASVPDLAPDPAATVDHDPRLTQSGVLMGTPAYMPPEQARGDLDRIGPASDVYSLGAILFELLTGRPPFQATPLLEMVRQIESQPAALPSTLRRGVPPGMDAICRRALAKDPGQRYPSMDAFAAALSPFASKGSSRGIRVALAAAVLSMLLAVAGVVFYVTTDNGTVEVRLNDASADVQVAVDGNDIKLTENGRVTRLRAGPHGLEVKGPNFETETRLFKVTRGEKTIVEVELKAKAMGTAQTELPPSTAIRARLALLLQRGRQLISQGRMDELGSLADEALRIDPESPGALALRATFRAIRNDFVSARADAEAALKLNPETFQALLIRDYVNGDEGKFDDSIADITVALRLDPTHPAAWANRSKSYFDKEEYHQAVFDATRAIELGFKRADALLNRACAYACLGEYKKAMADFSTAASLAPSDWRVFDQRSAVHAKLGNTEEAANDWERVKKFDKTLLIADRFVIPDPPKPPERKKLTAEEDKSLKLALATFATCWNKSDTAGSAKAAEDACRIDPTSGAARSARAQIWGELGKHEATVQEATEAIRLDPNLASAYIARGIARNRLKSPAAAIADLTIGLRLEPNSPTAYGERGLAYAERGQYHQALADQNQALQLKPDYAAAYPSRGDCYLRLAEFEKALADYSQASELSPTNPRWRLLCAAIRAKLGDDAGAKKDRDLAIRIDPKLKDAPDSPLPTPLPPAKKDPEVEPAAPAPLALNPDRTKLAGLLARGERMLVQGQLGDARGLVDQALKIDPESPGALGLRASLRNRQDDFVGAQADAEAALKLNPETFRALLVLSIQFGDEGNTDESIAVETMAIRLRPSYAWAWSNRASSYLIRKEYRQAIADATKAIELGLENPSPLLHRGAAYARLGMYDKALADYNLALKRAPDSPRAFDHRALLYAKMGDIEKSNADWKRAESLDPTLSPKDRGILPDPPQAPERKKLSPTEDKALKHALAAFEQCWHKADLEGSRKAAEDACRIDPTSAVALSSRAQIWGELGKHETAIQEAREAIRLDPNLASAYLTRGVAHNRLKATGAAIADLNIALRLDPNSHIAYGERGLAYFERGQYHQALVDLSEALRLKPDYAAAYPQRGHCYLRLADYKSALDDYAQAAELQPTNPRWRLLCAAIRSKLGDAAGAKRDRDLAIRIDPKLADAPDVTLPMPIPTPKRDPEATTATLASPAGG